MEEIQVSNGINFMHLFSGGLDSSYSLLKLATEHDKKKRGRIQPIFMDYGQRAAPTEWTQAQKLAHYIRDYLKDPQLYVKLLGSILNLICLNGVIMSLLQEEKLMKKRVKYRIEIWFYYQYCSPIFWPVLRTKASRTPLSR